MPPELTAVGLGPGDPELVTVKGQRAIQDAELVFVPRSRDGAASLALRIARPWIDEARQQVVELPLPMTRDAALLVPAWEQAADTIAARLAGGGRGVYLLLGDPLLYGTFTYIWQALARRHPQIAVAIVPGVTSFAAAAARAQTVLGTTDERLAIVPAPAHADADSLRDLLERCETLVLMKVGPVLPQVIEALDRLGLLDAAVYAEHVGMPEEQIVRDLRDLRGQTRPYLSLVLVRRPAGFTSASAAGASEEVFPAGVVYFIGAGPGAPDLLTVRARDLIARADLVLYADSLVEEDVARLARRPGARIVATSGMHLGEIVPLMVEAARAGLLVARVHSGDPALYGATHEQMVALDGAGVHYTIVPGVPSPFAAAAHLGVELTVPELTQTVILTRAAGRVAMPPGEDLRALAAHGASLSILLSVTRMRQVVVDLLAGGAYTPETPAAVLHRVSWPDESAVVGTLADIADKVRAAGYTRQAIIMVGPALDPALKGRADQPVSHLYDRTYTHRFRRAAQRPARLPRSDAPEASQPSETPSAARPVAVVAVTRGGTRLGRRLAEALDADLAVPARFLDEVGGAAPFADSALAEVRRRWPQHGALVLVMASGVAVRAIAPLLGAKAHDPAVVCVDEAGRSAIPLLGGHQSGANDLARRIAALTGGHAAITTASDVQDKPALDLLGRAQGWRIDPDSALTHASASLVNDEPVGVFLDPALPGLAEQARGWLAQADNLVPVDAVEELAGDAFAAGLIVSHRALAEQWRALQHRCVLYRPPALVAGLGCRRGVPAEELRDALETALAEAGLAIEALAALATVDLKADEPGLRALADGLGLPLRIVPRERLAALDPAGFSPSAAREQFDLPGVAEPCAVLEGGTLLLPKRAFARCTVAVALVGEGQA
ncbi:MAG TPA: precorrin-4 C(11)-methyltransferase [Roseiflexaceae bacterium]|nr:precorrin-4 C(11)-methyltransferase [Roseiflexaceae bacterium]